MFLKQRPIIWLIAPAIALVITYIFLYITPEQIVGNRESAISASALLLFISAPLAAVSSAIEANAEKRSKGVTELATRSAYSRILFTIAPSVLGGWIVQSIAVLVLLLRAGNSYGRTLYIMIGGFYAAIALHALCGYLLGRKLPKIMAIASAIIGSYGWVAFAWTVEPVQIRYMAGPALALCCSSAGQLNMRAAIVLLVFSLSLSIATFLITAGLLTEKVRPRRTWLFCVGAFVTILGVLISMTIGKPVGTIAENPMSEDRYSCSGSMPEVCLTDVQLSQSDQRESIQKVFAELQRRGLPRVNHVKPLPTGSNNLLEGDTAYVVISALTDQADAVHSAATTFSYSIDLSVCPAENFEDLYVAQNIFGAWLDTQAASVLDASTSDVFRARARDQLLAYEGATEKFDQVLSLEDTQQSQWAERAYQQLRLCQVPNYAGEER